VPSDAALISYVHPVATPRHVGLRAGAAQHRHRSRTHRGAAAPEPHKSVQTRSKIRAASACGKLFKLFQVLRH